MMRPGLFLTMRARSLRLRSGHLALELWQHLNAVEDYVLTVRSR
jgi:hypothetical protein